MQALVEEAEGSIVPTGFAHLDADGKADLSRSIDLAVTGRMAYIFSLGVLMGLPGTRRYVDHAVTALTKYFTDPVNGGMWYPDQSRTRRGRPRHPLGRSLARQIPIPHRVRAPRRGRRDRRQPARRARTPRNHAPRAERLLDRRLRPRVGPVRRSLHRTRPRARARHTHPHDRGLHGRRRSDHRTRMARPRRKK